MRMNQYANDKLNNLSNLWSVLLFLFHSVIKNLLVHVLKVLYPDCVVKEDVSRV